MKNTTGTVVQDGRSKLGRAGRSYGVYGKGCFCLCFGFCLFHLSLILTACYGKGSNKVDETGGGGAGVSRVAKAGKAAGRISGVGREETYRPWYMQTGASLLLGRGGASLMLCSPYARSSLSL